MGIYNNIMENKNITVGEYLALLHELHAPTNDNLEKLGLARAV